MTPDVQAAIQALTQVLHTAHDAALVRKVTYISHVPGVGVVGHVSVYRVSPWDYRAAELVLIPDALMTRWEDEVGRIELALGALESCEDKLSELDLASVLDCAPLEGPRPVTDEAIARREGACRRALRRFPDVAERMRDTYGLRLPQHVAAFWSFWSALDPIEHAAMEVLGRRPGGIMVWFEEDGLERRTRDGLDPRLHGRFRCDPPEFVTVMWGDTDGLHYGLWYDTPDELPPFIAANYARDDAETAQRGVNLFSTLLEDLFRLLEDPDPDRPEYALGALREALEWYERRAAVLEDAAEAPPASERACVTGGILSHTGRHDGDPQIHGTHRRYRVYKEDPDAAHQLANRAFEQLENGAPALALTIGRELHWLDAPWSQDLSRDLLVAAYEKLGRHALAEIARVHYAHRDLRTVEVFDR